MAFSVPIIDPDSPHSYAAPMVMMSKFESNDLRVFDLLVEDAGSLGCLVHIPALPGLNFRVEDTSELKATALARISEYARWLLAEGLDDLSPETMLLTQLVQPGNLDNLRVVEAEHMAGAPVWESGNPAVLFRSDRRPLDNDAVAAHLRFTRRVLERMRELVTPLSPEQRTRRPGPDRRSVDETLTHVGNCIWWYCSRIDDDLQEPDDIPDESPMDRIDRLFLAAEAFLLEFPLPVGATIHIPIRFPTEDPQEQWTHTKVCRRQSEHVWAHLPGLGNKGTHTLIRKNQSFSP